MKVNLDAKIDNILFVEYMNGKENGEKSNHLVDERRSHNALKENDFKSSRNIAPHLSKDC